MLLSRVITLQIFRAKPRNPKEGGREGGEGGREGEREGGREGGRAGGREGTRVKPGNQLVYTAV